MLRIADRYFIGRFIKTLVFALIAFIVIFVVVDLVENLDTFIDKHASMEVVATFYIYYLPYIFILVLPVAMLMASLFTMGQFVRYGELTALKAAGISLYRIFMPVFIFTFLVSCFSFWFGETIATDYQRNKEELRRYEINRMPRRFSQARSNIYLQDTGNRIVTITNYEARENVAYRVMVQERRNNRIVSLINADFMEPNGDGWKMYHVKIRDFSEGEEVYTEKDALLVEDFTFTIDDLERVQVKPEEMNIFELERYIDKLMTMGSPYGRWVVDFHNKIAFPFANMVVVLLGLPLATKSWRGGAAVGFGLSVFICFLYYVLMSFTSALGYKGTLSPVSAAWASNAVFGVLGVASLLTAKK